MHAPKAQAPALSSEAGPVLLRVQQQYPKLRTAAFHAIFRQQVIATFNAAIRESDADPAAVIARTSTQMGLGVSYLHLKKGMVGVREYLQPERIPSFVQIGRKIENQYIYEPLQALEQANIIDERSDEVYSASAKNVYEPYFDHDHAGRWTHLVSVENLKALSASEWSDFGQITSVNEDLKRANHALELVQTLGLNSKSIEKAKGNAIESGLVHLLRAAPIDRLGYLEVAVFTAAFAHRHELTPTSPLTFDAKNAALYRAELDDNLRMSSNVFAEYEQVCREIFPKHGDEAILLLKRYVEAVQEYATSEMQRVGSADAFSPELYFPVHRYSESALAPRKLKKT